jgi:hypothetical protein
MHERLIRHAGRELRLAVEVAEELDEGEAGVARDGHGPRELGGQLGGGQYDAVIGSEGVTLEHRLRFDEVDEAVLESLLGGQPLDVAQAFDLGPGIAFDLSAQQAGQLFDSDSASVRAPSMPKKIRGLSTTSSRILICAYLISTK